jgi:transcriptional activator HAC1
LARPLRDATGRALQLAVSEHFSPTWSAGAPEARPSWELLLTMAWAIDSLSLSQQGSTLKSGRRRINGKHRVSRSSRSSRRLSLLSKR